MSSFLSDCEPLVLGGALDAALDAAAVPAAARRHLLLPRTRLLSILFLVTVFPCLEWLVGPKREYLGAVSAALLNIAEGPQVQQSRAR